MSQITLNIRFMVSEPLVKSSADSKDFSSDVQENTKKISLFIKRHLVSLSAVGEDACEIEDDN
jgi:hypothetical protein